MRLFSNSTTRATCRVLLALMLFGYFAFAAQACVVPAVSAATETRANSTSDPCRDTDRDFCLTLSLQTDETLDSHPGLATTNATPPVIAAAPAVHAITTGDDCRTLPPHLGPPLYIGICRLLR